MFFIKVDTCRLWSYEGNDQDHNTPHLLTSVCFLCEMKNVNL